MRISDNLRGALCMIVSMGGLTINDAFMKSVLAEMPLFQTIAMRGTLAFAALLGFALATGGLRLRLPAATARLVGLRGLCEVLTTVLFLSALMRLPFATVQSILQVVPIAVTFAAVLVLGERVGWRRGGAIVAGFIGVLLIIRPGPDGLDPWALVGLSVVAVIVVRELLTRRLPRDLPSATVALWTAGMITLAGAAASLTETWVMPTPLAAAQIFGAAVFLFLGYLFSVMAIRTGDVGATAPFRYSALLWALLLGWLVFAEFPDPVTLVGAALVVGSGLVTLRRERGRLAPRQPLP